MAIGTSQKAQETKIIDSKESKVRVDGVVEEVLPDTKYRIKVKVGGLEHKLIGYPSGKIRKNYIKIQEGDEVVVELDLYSDLDIGRVVFRKDKGRSLPNFAKPTMSQDNIVQN